MAKSRTEQLVERLRDLQATSADVEAAAIVAPEGARTRRRGPQAGHAFGWAWKRRSSGSAYSRAHAGHIRNPAIVVAGRS